MNSEHQSQKKDEFLEFSSSLPGILVYLVLAIGLIVMIDWYFNIGALATSAAILLVVMIAWYFKPIDQCKVFIREYEAKFGHLTGIEQAVNKYLPSEPE